MPPRKALEQESPNIWEPTSLETKGAYPAFATYRDMGPERTISEAAKLWLRIKEQERAEAENRPPREIDHLEHHRLHRRWEKWARVHQWKDRALAYDVWVERMRLREMEKAARQAAERHAAVGVMMYAKASRVIQDMDFTQMRPNELLAYTAGGVEIERKARGMGEIARRQNELAGGSAPAGSADFTLDQIEEIAKLARELDSGTHRPAAARDALPPPADGAGGDGGVPEVPA